MAVGPTEALQAPNVFHITQSQADISGRMSTMVVNVLRGMLTAKVNPDSAIPPANSPQSLRTEGIGSQLDLDA